MKLTDAEKTRRLAEGCMGWEVFPLDRDGYSEAMEPKLIQQITGTEEQLWAVYRNGGKSEIWQPLTNESHAAEVREAMRAKGWEVVTTYAKRREIASMSDKAVDIVRSGEHGKMMRLSAECALLALGLAQEEEL